MQNVISYDFAMNNQNFNQVMGRLLYGSVLGINDGSGLPSMDYFDHSGNWIGGGDGKFNLVRPGDPEFIGPLTEFDAARVANWKRPDGSTWWPPNNGAVIGSEKSITMEPGETFGRIGYDTGKYVAPCGTSTTLRN